MQPSATAIPKGWASHAPEANNPTGGTTCKPLGGSLIFLEVIKDCSREPPPFDATAKEQDTVVHGRVAHPERQ